MDLAQLAAQLKLPTEYVTYLWAIHEGVETDGDAEDVELAEGLSAQLSTLVLDND